MEDDWCPHCGGDGVLCADCGESISWCTCGGEDDEDCPECGGYGVVED